MITTRDPAPAARRAGQAAMAAAALRDFRWRYPAYAGTAVLDELRARDYARLDAGHVYLDYAGGGLFAGSQLARHRALLAGAVPGNPHPANLPPRGPRAPGWRQPGRRSWNSSAPPPGNTRSSSPPTPPARCGWPAGPAPPGRAAGWC